MTSAEKTDVSWRSISSNPVDPAVHRHQQQRTRRICQPVCGHPDLFLRGFVEGASVLDIGCAEHDETHWVKAEWQHAKIKSWARTTLGLDILPSAVAALCARGFNVVCADATSDTDLGQRFDRVVIGDVIEHVERPVQLLQFAVRHLAPGGKVLVRTPNPFWWRFYVRALREGLFIENAEHAAWFTPCNALELADRAGIKLLAYHPTYGRLTRYTPGYWLLRGISGREPETLASAYLFIFGRRDG